VVEATGARLGAAAGEEDAAAVALALPGDASSVGDSKGLHDESEVFLTPRLIGANGAELREQAYSSAEQALLLGWATQVKKGTSRDELQNWQAAPYVEAVLQQPRTQCALQATARLFKVRHERSRPRTRERSLMSLEQLTEAVRDPAAAPPAHVRLRCAGPPFLPRVAAAAIPLSRPHSRFRTPRRRLSAAASAPPLRCCCLLTPCPPPPLPLSAAPHLRWAYSVWLPPLAALQRELAEAYVAMGLVGAALRLYESLEAWGPLISCYQLLDKRAIADTLVRARLLAEPDSPQLWSALGDLHGEDK